MHCNCCNKLLTDYESTRKNAITRDYIDLCRVCFEDVKGLFLVLERKDLITEADLDPSERDVDMNDNDVSSREMDTRDCRDYIYYIVSNDVYNDT